MDATNLIPWSISAISLLFVILTFYRNGQKDIKEEERKDESKIDGIRESLIRFDLKLDQVVTISNETRTDVRTLKDNVNDIDRRITIVERDMKTAFNQIEDIKKKGEDK